MTAFRYVLGLAGGSVLDMYLLITLSVLLWAVLFGTGAALWWSVSKPESPLRRGTLPRRTRRSRHRVHRRHGQAHA